MTTKQKIVIIGGGGHARVLLDILRLRKQGGIAGYIDHKECAQMPLTYLGKDVAFMRKFSPKQVVLVNGVGSIGLPQVRQAVYARFKKDGFSFLSILHPQAVIAVDAVCGEGVQVMAGAVINTGAQVLENVIVNTLSSIDHDSVVGAHTHIAPGVTVSGDVRIGRGCHVGTGAKLIQGICIGNKVFIAAGTVVVKDVPDGKIILGVPGKMKE